MRTQTRQAPTATPGDLAGGGQGLRIRELTFAYGNTVAVDDLDLEVEAGEFFTLLGPSGCGKSTTLMAVAGFLAPREGRIWVSGDEVTRVPSNRRPTNYVFQNYALFPHMSVAENVAYGLKRRRFPAREVRTRVATELERVDMAALADRRPQQLSGGQQQRVALARALVNRPALLLLDEPLAALDRKLRVQLRGELRRIQQEIGTTTVLVTHDQDEALSLSDRVGVMRNGGIEQIGTPEALYESPKTEFVAGFLGTSNLLRGTVLDRHGASCSVELDLGSRAQVPVPESARVDAGGRCVLMVRPENVRVTQSPSGEALSFSATAESVLYEGASYEAAFRLADESLVKVRLDSSARGLVAESSALTLEVSTQHLRLLEAEAP